MSHGINHTYVSWTLCCLYVIVSSCVHGLQRTGVTGCPDLYHRLVSVVSLKHPKPPFITFVSAAFNLKQFSAFRDTQSRVFHHLLP